MVYFKSQSIKKVRKALYIIGYLKLQSIIIKQQLLERKGILGDGIILEEI